MNKNQERIDELEKVNKELKEKNSRLNKSRNENVIWMFVWAFAFFLSVGLMLVISNLWSLNWSERDFCLDKLRTNFPEYGFISAKLDIVFGGGINYDYFCVGNYPVGEVLQKDGLRSQEGTASKSFQLIDKNDIDWVKKDDNSAVVYFFRRSNVIFCSDGFYWWNYRY